MSQSDIDPALDPTLDHVSRRSFLEKMGMSTVAAAVLGKEAMEQEKKTSAMDDPNLSHEEITFPSGEHRIQGFLCRPHAEGKLGAVIVVHEIFGVTDHIKDIACRVAKAGFTGLAVDFFTREGKPPSTDGGFQPLMDFVGKIPDSQIIGDVRAAAKYLRGRADSNGKVGVVGFCWGGNVSMLADGEIADLDAAVAYYGRIRLPENADRSKKPHAPIELVSHMHAPLLGHFGALDNSIPTADVDALRDELKKQGKTGEIYSYEGANHAFNNDTRPSYNADASKLAWRRTLEWFDKYLK